MSEEKIKKIEKSLGEILEKLETDHETRIQQQSGQHSDLLKKITDIEKKMADLDKNLSTEIDGIKETLKSWGLGGKIGFWVLIALGGFITWLLNTFGLHFSTSK